MIFVFSLKINFMGVTSIDVRNLESLIRMYNPTSVIDLGAQNNFAQPNLPAPYMSEWWRAKGVRYESIDLNAENDCLVMNLSKNLGLNGIYDFVMDFGTSEHVGTNGAFDWEAIYNCWKNKFDLCRIGGLIISENPKTGNWPFHGFNFYTDTFYKKMSQIAGLDLLIIAEIAAMGNIETGWNIYAVLLKTSKRFISFEDFKTLDLRQS